MKNILMAGLVLLIATVACQKPGQTPEDTFNKFSLSAASGQPAGLDKFAEPEYSREYQNRYDNIGILQGIWPRNIVIVKKSEENGVVTLDVQGTAANTKTINGQFKLRKAAEMWKVFEGDWIYRPEEQEIQAGQDPQ